MYPILQTPSTIQIKQLFALTISDLTSATDKDTKRFVSHHSYESITFKNAFNRCTCLCQDHCVSLQERERERLSLSHLHFYTHLSASKTRQTAGWWVAIYFRHPANTWILDFYLRSNTRPSRMYVVHQCENNSFLNVRRLLFACYATGQGREGSSIRWFPWQSIVSRRARFNGASMNRHRLVSIAQLIKGNGVIDRFNCPRCIATYIRRFKIFYSIDVQRLEIVTVQKSFCRGEMFLTKRVIE